MWGETPLPFRLACRPCAKVRPSALDSARKNRLPLAPPRPPSARSQPRQQAGPAQLQHLPHFRAQQHLHPVSSDTQAGCANTATCRSRVRARSQSAGPRRERERPGPHPAITQRLHAPLSDSHSELKGQQSKGPAPPHGSEPGPAPSAPRLYLRATHCSRRKLTSSNSGVGEVHGAEKLLARDTRGGWVTNYISFVTC